VPAEQQPVLGALGHPRVHLRRTDSTNDRARAVALAGAPHGTLVTATEQTAGRGRQGRRWSAPPGSALLMSLVLRAGRPVASAAGEPALAPAGMSGAGVPPSVFAATVPAAVSAGSGAPDVERSWSLLPLAAAVAVCDVCGGEARVKWPNDVVLENSSGGLAKLAGILIEGRPQQGWAVLGIGVNVAVRIAELPAELRGSATTLGREREAIEPLLTQLLGALERRLGEPATRTLAAWRERDALRGREISWSDGSGHAQGVDEQGRLLVAPHGGGRVVALAAGEVHLGWQRADRATVSGHRPAGGRPL
jgi:BirA family biotin operon repressor/biotin-[acetyl-CoA-carboxylase] ligase